MERVNAGPYLLKRAPDHPHAMKTGYVAEHRLIMESQLGRYLTTSEVVHHLNGDTKDNRPENLRLCANNAEHFLKYHGRKWIKCFLCDEWSTRRGLCEPHYRRIKARLNRDPQLQWSDFTSGKINITVRLARRNAAGQLY